MGANENGGIPVEAVCVSASFRLRFYVDRLASAAVVPVEIASLPLHINDVGILRVGKGLVTITAQGNEPVRVTNTAGVLGT